MAQDADAIAVPFVITGRLAWIGLRPLRRAPVKPVEEAIAVRERGLEGDHFTPKRGNRRQVTLVQWEDLGEIARTLGIPGVAPELLRRNLVVSGIRLCDAGNQWIQLGEVLLRPTGPCVPCSRMDEALGAGGRLAMRGKGGLTAEIVKSGRIRVGDPVAFTAEADVM